MRLSRIFFWIFAIFFVPLRANCICPALFRRLPKWGWGVVVSNYMQNMNRIDTYYFIGIGGIGMSALARYMAAQGLRVLGYDRTSSPLTQRLESEGIQIAYDDRLDPLRTLDVATTLVVRTPAVPEDLAIYVYLREQGFRILKRAELLGELTMQQRALCVAGTHGKTTTSTILAHILHNAHIGASAFLGGIANNYASNLIIDKQSDWVVVEADEFDRSFHHLAPYMSVITSMDPDHLDIYGTAEAYVESFMHYAALVQEALVIKADIAEQFMAAGHNLSAQLYTYDVDKQADFYADHIRVEDGQIYFDFHFLHNELHDIRLGVPVMVNIENSVAAMALAYLAGATPDELRHGVESFAGVHRRFDIHIRRPELTYIDDYAHHPQELAATIRSVRLLYPDSHVIAAFQPHLYSRTRDFVDDFARVLSQLDEVALLPIYPAREEPIAGVTSEWLMTKIHTKRVLASPTSLPKYLRLRLQQCREAGQKLVVLTMGAGDIDRLVAPITRNLTYKIF